jgi:hypothetical protein
MGLACVKRLVHCYEGCIKTRRRRRRGVKGYSKQME